jgi:hypothetical protein
MPQAQPQMPRPPGQRLPLLCLLVTAGDGAPRFRAACQLALRDALGGLVIARNARR